MNSEAKPQFSLNFSQFLTLLLLQIGLLAGSFYLGARWSGGNFSKQASEADSTQDEKIAKVFPQNPPENNSNSLKRSDSILAEKPEKEKFIRLSARKGASDTIYKIKSSANSEYTLQISSYPEQSDASQAVSEWKRKGYNAFVSVEENGGEGRWYRVNIGNFGDPKSAEEFAKTFQEKEKLTPQIVVNE